MDNIEFEHDTHYTYVWCWDSVAEDANGTGMFYMMDWRSLTSSAQKLEGFED